MKRPELLAPAGDLEKLKTAVLYGADAVYFGGEDFSLRSGAGGMSTAEMAEGIAFAHARGVKCHLAVNAFPENGDIEPLREYLHSVKDIGVDAFIAADPGVIDLIFEVLPGAEVHLSTQANTTNYRAAAFWYRQGVKRIVAAREMSLADIKKMKELSPDGLEIEAFVHGAMCISYSGRCLLSSFMTGRSANHGECAHPCRWNYRLVEEQRPGVYYPIEEDDRGSYILNSKDLCMIDHLPELIDAGVTSFKIEGRMKSVFYVATVVSAYRRAIDACMASPEEYAADRRWFEELCKVSHREFTTGFYFGKTDGGSQNYLTSQYTRDYAFIGIVKGYDAATGYAAVEQRNKFSVGDTIEIFGPGADFFEQKIEAIYDEEGTEIQSAPHPQQLVRIRTEKPVAPFFILRKRKE